MRFNRASNGTVTACWNEINSIRPFLITMATAEISSTPCDSKAVSPNHSLQSEYVVLLHGLCRTSRSMTKMQRALEAGGYTVVNLDYPSRTGHIQNLADDALGKALPACRRNGATKIDFVT